MENTRNAEELLTAREAAAANLEAAKSDLKTVDDEINQKFLAPLQEEYRLMAKNSGTVKCHTGIVGIEAHADIKKTVTWDQAKLRAVMQGMTWEQIQRLFKIDVEVGEKVFNDIADMDLKAKLTDARMVKYAEPKITLKKAAA